MITIIICKNKKGNLGFIGTNAKDRPVEEITKIYGYRWEIENYFRDIKQNLNFNDFKLRGLGANFRWQTLSLVAANILEVIKKAKLEKTLRSDKYFWLKKSLKFLYSTIKLTLGITLRVIQNLKNGGKELIFSLKCKKCYQISKYYLYKRVNL